MQSVGDMAACLDRITRGVAMRARLMSAGAAGGGVPYAEPLAAAVGLFEALGVGYALIGGVAAMFYGRLRLTEDLDFVAASGHEAVLAANPAVMAQYGFDPACTWKLYHASSVDIDIWKDEFSADVVARAVLVRAGGLDLRVAEPHDLIAMKLRAGRLRDDYDVAEIARSTAIDEGRLAALVTAGQLTRYREICRRTP